MVGQPDSGVTRCGAVEPAIRRGPNDHRMTSYVWSFRVATSDGELPLARHPPIARVAGAVQYGPTPIAMPSKAFHMLMNQPQS
jgi:hypothetical protein